MNGLRGSNEIAGCVPGPLRRDLCYSIRRHRMYELNVVELDAVDGAMSQGEVVATNMAIVGMGVAIAITAGATAPVWFPVAMIAVSIASVVTMDK